MNKKAFTLVELLVTIVILGIITGISIPLIRNVRESQQRKQYETYRNSLSYASKVYADSFSEDLFGHDEIACATVSYNQLRSKNLIKDIPIDGISCASNDTFVRIVKFEDQYSYLPKITCGVSQTGGSISKDVEIPEGNVDSDLCGLNVDTKIDIIFNPESSHTPNVQRKNINVEFKSPTGIHSDPIIYWAFSDKADFSSIIGEWKQLDIDVPSKKKQKAQILQGSTISLTKEFITPKNYSGKLYLVLKIDRLQDLGGKNWTNTDTEVVSGGYYAVDNEPPLLNDSEIKYSKPVHRQVTPTLNFKATDNLTSESNLRMCISEDTATDTCSKNINNIKKKQNGWVTYNKSKVLPIINNATDEKNHNIFVSIGDQAGNYVTKQVVYYHSPVDYSITYNLDGGTHGTSHPPLADFDETFTVDYPIKKIKLTFENKVSGVNIDYSSSTVSESGKSENYTFNGWNISGMDNTTHILGSTQSNMTEAKNVKAIKFMGLRNTTGGVIFDATWTPPQIILPKANKTGYTCKWTSPTSYEWASGGKYTPSVVGGATARTFTTSCSANTFTVAYNANGGSGTTASHDCTYDSDCNLKTSGFSKSGYTFAGWKKNNAGSIVAAGTSIKNEATGGTITYYAQWKANTFTVAYNANGGSGTTSSHTCTYDSDCNLKTSGFSKSGYTFAGWKKNNAGSIVAAGTSIKNEATGGTITYYAQWTKHYVNIKLNANGGVYKGTNPNYKLGTGGKIIHNDSEIIHKVAYGEKMDAAGLANWNNKDYLYLQKTGYSIDGTKAWSVNANGSGKNYDQDVAYSASDFCDASKGDCTVTLYANWKANTFTIKYDGNGNNHGTMGNTTCTYDSNCTLSANTFTKLGYTFLGWSTSSSATSATYKNQDNLKNAATSGTIKLYAIWKKNIWMVSSPEGGADTFKAATAKAKSGATLTLTKTYNDSETSYVVIDNKKLTINYSGYVSNLNDGIDIRNGAEIIINADSSGGIISKSGVLGVYRGCKLTINNGTYENKGSGSHAVTVLGGTFIMNGGTLVSRESTHGVLMLDTKTANSINPEEASITVKNATIASRKGYGILANDSSIKKMTLVLEDVTISGSGSEKQGIRNETSHLDCTIKGTTTVYGKQYSIWSNGGKIVIKSFKASNYKNGAGKTGKSSWSGSSITTS